jgi:cell division protease FtsH
MSNAVAETVDKEIRRIIDEQYARARTIIEENRDKVEKMAKTLIEWETLDADQINAIMAGREPRPPEGWTDKPSSGTPPKPKAKPGVKPRLDTAAGEH